MTASGKLVLLSRDYDRTRALVDGRGRLGGGEFAFEVADSAPETFRRVRRDDDVVAGEMSLGFHVASVAAGDTSFVGLPVFLSRSFRHGNVFVRQDSELSDFGDLRGRRVGLEEYAMTMGTWVRSLFADAGLSPSEIRWHTARNPVVAPEVEARLAAQIDLQRVESGTLWQLLERGDLDAVIGRPPDHRQVDRGPFRRLLRDHWTAQRRYFSDTGVFPIMHLVVVRRRDYEAEPTIATALFECFSKAKSIAEDELRTNLNTLPAMLPMLEQHVAETDELFGTDWWPYGVDRNRDTLDRFIRYSHDQGLIERRLDVDELFCPETYPLAEHYDEV